MTKISVQILFFFEGFAMNSPIHKPYYGVIAKHFQATAISFSVKRRQFEKKAG